MPDITTAAHATIALRTLPRAASAGWLVVGIVLYVVVPVLLSRQ